MTALKSQRGAARSAVESVLAWPPPWVRNGEPETPLPPSCERVTQSEITLRHFSPAGRDFLADVLRRAIQKGREESMRGKR